MKISVCGKGGSGKSAVTILLANAFRKKGYRVLVMDSDESNFSLHRGLGFDTAPVPLLDLAGGKQQVKNLFPRSSRDPSGQTTGVLGREKLRIADIPGDYILSRDGVHLVSVGKILHSLEGCACPMGLLGREFLNKLELETDEVVIVDTEAGLEHFGRGVETGVDAVLVIVDPAYESLRLAARIAEMVRQMEVPEVYAVLNKVPSADIAGELSGELSRSNLRVIGTILYEPAIFEAGLYGRTLELGVDGQEADQIVEALLAGFSNAGTKS
ncbi:MAG: P-loop NTPase [Dehalococcoidia bacterium]|nr:P-loop NTPase [Dehalococcoidia bacterium]